MLVRRSSSDLARARRRLNRKRWNPLLPLLLGGGVGAAITFHLGFLGDSYYGGSLKAEGLTRELIWGGILIWTVVFAITYVLQILGYADLTAQPRICRTCLRSTSVSGKVCACGGILEPGEYYEFVDERPNKSLERTRER